ncbi:phosphatase PAP2 family protein [Actinophytocola glycyrrhizae]|uniref:Phosphatase PAP2 family protein n=1 Tax=Actinophytocola glycyrrhizae TaxID=2044873 RepID=A0ABV9RVU3_9PSEU
MLHHPWQSLGVLTVTWVLLIGALAGLGTLLSRTSGPALGWDRAVVAWLAGHRDPTLTAVLHHVGQLGSTRMVMLAVLVAAPLAVAITRTWQPVLLLAVGLLGELTLFLATTAIVDRHRPDVPQLNPNLPPTSSFPSGHVAATLVVYTGIALLAHRLLRSWWRWPLVAAAAAVPVLVAVQRLYAGVHYPTDILGSALLALPWILVCRHVLRTEDRTGRPHSGWRRTTGEGAISIPPPTGGPGA